MSDAAPLVGIVMGSDSDWAVMQEAADALDALSVPYEVDVVSAHRTPDRLMQYGSTAVVRGLRVIVAGAGGAAHLPGMLASLTSLPIVGVPVPLAHMDGLDSLLSIVQMPAGVPVATVSVGNARNGGLLAARILASGTSEADRALHARLEDYRAQLAEDVAAKAASLRQRRQSRTGF